MTTVDLTPQEADVVIRYLGEVCGSTPWADVAAIESVIAKLQAPEQTFWRSGEKVHIEGYIGLFTLEGVTGTFGRDDDSELEFIVRGEDPPHYGLHVRPSLLRKA